MKRRAFTLVELLVVIAIIGLLSTVAVISLNQTRSKSRDAKRQADVKQIITAMQMYYDVNGAYPNTIALGCGATADTYCLGHGSSGTCWINTVTGCTALDNALSPYMSKIPDDPENNTADYGDAYTYDYSSTLGGTPAGPVLHWGYDQTTNSSNCLGGTFGQWGGGRFRYWCALKLQP